MPTDGAARKINSERRIQVLDQRWATFFPTAKEGPFNLNLGSVYQQIFSSIFFQFLFTVLWFECLAEKCLGVLFEHSNTLLDVSYTPLVNQYL